MEKKPKKEEPKKTTSGSQGFSSNLAAKINNKQRRKFSHKVHIPAVPGGQYNV